MTNLFRRFSCLGCLFGMVLPLAAQVPTLSVSGTLVATASGVTQQFGPAALPPAGASASQVVPSAQATSSIGPAVALPAGTAGLRSAVSGTALIPSFGQPAGSFSASSDVLLSIAPVAMGTAVLVVRWQATAGGGTASASIDIGDDGSNEWSEAVSLFRPSADVTGELGVAVAAGTPVRVRQSAQGTALFGFVQSQARLDLTVFPGASPIANGASGCLPLTWVRPDAGAVELRCTPPSGSPTIYVFGFAPQNGTLPYPPGCPLLLQVATMVPVAAVGGMAAFSVPTVVLPPGFVVHAQAIPVVGPNDVRSTGSLVMHGV